MDIKPYNPKPTIADPVMKEIHELRLKAFIGQLTKAEIVRLENSRRTYEG